MSIKTSSDDLVMFWAEQKVKDFNEKNAYVRNSEKLGYDFDPRDYLPYGGYSLLTAIGRNKEGLILPSLAAALAIGSEKLERKEPMKKITERYISPKLQKLFNSLRHGVALTSGVLMGSTLNDVIRSYKTLQ